MNTTINDRAAEIMTGIKARIAAAHAEHVARKDAAATKRAAIEAENQRSLAESQAYFKTIFDRTAKGCQLIFDLLGSSPDLREYISFVESEWIPAVNPKRFCFFMDNQFHGMNGNDADMSLVISLRVDVIEVTFDGGVSGEKIVTLKKHEINSFLSQLFFQENLCGWLDHNFQNYKFLGTMENAYRKIPSPLSWNIPWGFFGPVTFRLLALRVLEQCSRPHLLARHMDWALKHNAPSAGK